MYLKKKIFFSCLLRNVCLLIIPHIICIWLSSEFLCSWLDQLNSRDIIPCHKRKRSATTARRFNAFSSQLEIMGFTDTIIVSAAAIFTFLLVNHVSRMCLFHSKSTYIQSKMQLFYLSLFYIKIILFMMGWFLLK